MMAGNYHSTSSGTLLTIKTHSCVIASGPYRQDIGTNRRETRRALVDKWLCAIVTRLLVWLIEIHLAGRRSDNDVDEEA